MPALNAFVPSFCSSLSTGTYFCDYAQNQPAALYTAPLVQTSTCTTFYLSLAGPGASCLTTANAGAQSYADFVSASQTQLATCQTQPLTVYVCVARGEPGDKVVPGKGKGGGNGNGKGDGFEVESDGGAEPPLCTFVLGKGEYVCPGE